MTPGAAAWLQAASAAALCAVDPVGLGGLLVRAHPGPVRDALLALLASLRPNAPARRLPAHAPDARLLGGLDLAATLAAGRPVVERGLLADAHGGVLTIPMAERLSPGTAARITQAIDRGEVTLERDGITAAWPACFAVVALDEGLDGEDGVPEAMRDRLGFHLDLRHVRHTDCAASTVDSARVAAAVANLEHVIMPDAGIAILVETAAAFGIGSTRAASFALRAARAAAALAGRGIVTQDDLILAAQLVLAPRATMRPAAEPEDAPEPPPPEPSSDTPPRAEDAQSPETDKPLADRVVEAVAVAIPADLLAHLAAPRVTRRGPTDGSAGAMRASIRRGRPLGSRRGDPRSGQRLDLVETLRAAAPWQPLRRPPGSARVAVRRDDFRVRRFKEATQTTTIFVVDASGSQALHRLGEAKGAVELLLAECYVRRDQVALVAFRDRGAQLLLPPTRSLARAKRSLAALPGGGGTPLAAGLEAGLQLATELRRRGGTAVLVLLTDGQANITREGRPGRAEASAEASAVAKALRVQGIPAILVDTAPRPQARAEKLATEMAARYVALPGADARGIGRAIAMAAATV